MHLFRTLFSCSLTCKLQTKATNRKPFFKKIETKLESFEFDPKRKVIIVGDLTRTWIASVATLKLKKKELREIKDVMLANDLIDMLGESATQTSSRSRGDKLTQEYNVG